MPINIKEIFKSDLDPNSNDWWSIDKTDKINHNFKQLTSGGMTGPMGAQGSFGISGFMGDQGPQGFKGALGDLGSQGNIGITQWVVAEGTASNPLLTDSLHLFPNRQLPIEYAPTAMRIGYPNPSSSLPESYYGSVLTLNSPNIPSTPWKRNNLKLTTQLIDAVGHETTNIRTSEHRLYKSTTSTILPTVYEYGRIRSSSPGFINRTKLNLGDTYYIEGQTSSVKSDLIKLNHQELTINNKLTTRDFYANKDFMIESGAAADKVLMSVNPIGQVKWVDKYYAFPGYLEGMVISIPDWAFNSTNFEIQTQYTQSASGEPIRFNYGRGKIGGQYEGWYLCNGKKWNSSAGINETLVPNMHYVELNIGSNDNQQQVIDTNDSSIMGGHPMEMNAIYKGGNKYDINYNNTFLNNNDSQDTINLLEDSSKSYSVSKMIHIVKLGFNDLEWEDSTSVPPTLNNISLYGPYSNPDDTCNDLTTSAFRWDGPSSFAYWSTFTSPYKLYQLTTYTYAPSGWYRLFGETTCRYWDQSTGSFTSATPNTYSCPVSTQISAAYSQDVNGVDNGSTGSSTLLNINNTDWSAATSIKYPISGGLANAGWYRIYDAATSTYGSRRYWNGTSFDGEEINFNYVNTISLGTDGIKALTSSTGAIACSSVFGVGGISLYVASNNAPVGWSDIGSINPTTAIMFYVHKNWATTTIKRTPLVKIKNQPAPGSTSATVTYLADYTLGTFNIFTGTFDVVSESYQNVGIFSNPNGGADC